MCKGRRVTVKSCSNGHPIFKYTRSDYSAGFLPIVSSRKQYQKVLVCVDILVNIPAVLPIHSSRHTITILEGPGILVVVDWVSDTSRGATILVLLLLLLAANRRGMRGIKRPPDTSKVAMQPLLRL